MAGTSEAFTPVRLLVTTDWYLEGTVLIDVAPGAEYEASAESSRPIAIHTIKVINFFELSWISVGAHRFEGGECRAVNYHREYRLDPPLEVTAHKKILLALRNGANSSKVAPKVIMVDDFGNEIDSSSIEPHPPRRASEFTAVAPPQEPTLTAAAEAKTLAVRGEAVPSSVFTDVTSRGGAIMISERGTTIEAYEGRTMRVTDGTSGSHTAAEPPFRFELNPPLPMDPSPTEDTHRPLLARTLYDGPGNKTSVRGCSCGADITSVEMFAAHVAWPIEAVQMMLDLAGIADDLLDYRELRREDVWPKIARCMEVRR